MHRKRQNSKKDPPKSNANSINGGTPIANGENTTGESLEQLQIGVPQSPHIASWLVESVGEMSTTTHSTLTSGSQTCMTFTLVESQVEAKEESLITLKRDEDLRCPSSSFERMGKDHEQFYEGRLRAVEEAFEEVERRLRLAELDRAQNQTEFNIRIQNLARKDKEAFQNLARKDKEAFQNFARKDKEAFQNLARQREEHRRESQQNFETLSQELDKFLEISAQEAHARLEKLRGVSVVRAVGDTMTEQISNAQFGNEQRDYWYTQTSDVLVAMRSRDLNRDAMSCLRGWEARLGMSLRDFQQHLRDMVRDRNEFAHQGESQASKINKQKLLELMADRPADAFLQKMVEIAQQTSPDLFE